MLGELGLDVVEELLEYLEYEEEGLVDFAN